MICNCIFLKSLIRVFRWDTSGAAATELGTLGKWGDGVGFGRAVEICNAGVAVDNSTVTKQLATY